jgi:acyl-CoA synthetase (NDP forming)/GNAT superfamily N-acetyltransferase
MFRIIKDWQNYQEYVLLRDGLGITLRTATSEDIPAVEKLINKVSETSRYFRFMAEVSYVSKSTVEQMCKNNPREQASLLAIIGDSQGSRVIGIGNYVSLGVKNVAEVAFLVDDQFQGKGIGTLLLERLAGIAAANGFVGFEAEMLYENQKMMTVFKDAGFELLQIPGGSTVHIEFPVSGTAALREQAELRDRIASANSLRPLLRPKSVAVVGASRDRSSVGSLVFRHILESNFTGTVYPVNNQATSIQGVRAYPSLLDLPEQPELVVIAVPAQAVIDVVKDAARVGAKGLIVLSAGFAENGENGAAMQRNLVDLTRSSGMRLIGPNCLGIINTQNDIRLNASLAEHIPPSGKVGFYSHSEALGVVILDYAAERGIGFSTFVSGGNRADVSGNDLMQYWEEDPATDIVLLYLESFGNPRKFARVARRLSYKKPVLCVKSGRSRAGRETIQARAQSTESEVQVEALFQQAGVIRAETLEEMFDVAVLLAHQPLPRGNKVAIVSNAGGVLTIAADACESNGLIVPQGCAANLGPTATADDYEKYVKLFLERDDVNSLIAIFACIGGCDPEPVGRAIRRGVIFSEKTTGVPKPVLLCLMGSTKAIQLAATASLDREKSTHNVFPSYRFPESAALALAKVVQYSNNRLQPSGRLLWYEDVDAPSARGTLEKMLENEKEVLQLYDNEAEGILKYFGLSLSKHKEEYSGKLREMIHVGVQYDPHFGPLIWMGITDRPMVQRITPLTDRDAIAMMEACGVQHSWGIEELLGRISQMVEEMPWLWEMKCCISPEQGKLPELCSVKLAFKP